MIARKHLLQGLGMDLDAGPLPAIGNLILHLIYGATLGAMYAIPEVSTTSDRVNHAEIARQENDGLAAGLLIGLLVGVVVGVLLGMFVDTGAFSETGMLLASAGLGSVFGGMLGAFAGLGVSERHDPGASTPQPHSGQP